MIEHAIELAFDGKMQLKFYQFLEYRKTKKVEVELKLLNKPYGVYIYLIKNFFLTILSQ